MVDAVEGHEITEGTRTRAGMERDRESFVEMGGIVVANLAHAVLVPPQPYGWMAMRMSNLKRPATQQDNPVFGKPAPKLVRALEEMGFVAIHRPPRVSGESSSIWPTDLFRDMVLGQGVTLDDFGRHPN